MKKLTMAGFACTVALLTAIAPASARSRLNGADFYVHNQTGILLTVLSATPVDQRYIEPENYIHPVGDPGADADIEPYSGERVTMHGDSCYYNIVGHFADGSTRWKDGVDLCRITDFTFNP